MNGANHHINPYIIGRPIYERTKFFGRESLFRFIEDNLNQGVKVILLHGQRRIGKSSVLHQFSNYIQSKDFIFVQFDLQDKNQSTLSDIICDLAMAITEQLSQLSINTDNLKPLTNAQLEEDINSFSQVFLPNVYEIINNQKIVLLFDEFDVANDDVNDVNIVEQKKFFPYLKKLLKEQDKLFIIPVIGRYLNDLPNLVNLFKDAPYQEISLLDDISVKRMITKPAEGTLIKYQPEAIQEIIQLSAGHPYFTQAICFTLFNRARSFNRWVVNNSDVDEICEQAIANSDAGLQGFWQVLSIPERIIISTVAEAQDRAIKQGGRVPEEPLSLLKSLLNINGENQRESLLQGWERLIKNGYLSADGRKIRVELIRRWLLQCHPLQNEIQNLPTQENVNIENLVENLILVAKFLSQQGEKQQALELYERAFGININNDKIAISLAEQYLELKNFERSLELHKQLFQGDSQYSKEKYLEALSEYGHHLIIQGEYTPAKEQFQKILEIEPNRRFAAQRILEIETFEKNPLMRTPDINNSVTPPREINRRGSTLKTILALVAVLVLGSVGYATYRFSSECPIGKQKEWGLLCIEDQGKISNGDRPLFPNIKNSYRDQGIQAFKRKDYPVAIKQFGEAIKANPNDPEVRIYYNNASARKTGNPITLAVAVPADDKYTNLAQETLRGVAQAQEEFNRKNGLNGRLLEIKIANDAGLPEQAKEVAAELVKDTSILGVIGHNSSDSTKAALEEYNKTDIPVISSTSTSTQLLRQRNFFRSLPSDAAGGKKLAEYAFKTLKLTKVVIFSNPANSYSNSMREEFTKTFEKLGGDVLRKPQINLAEMSPNTYEEVNTSIYGQKAEGAVLIPDRKNINIALKIARLNQVVAERFRSTNRNRSAMKLLGGDTLYSNDILSQGGNAVEGLIVVVPWFRDVPQAKNFAKKAKELWGREVSWRTATSYDATQAFIQALSTNSERTTVIEKLKSVNLSQADTSGDKLQFSPEGERQTEPILVQIQGGKWVMLPPK